MLVSKDMDYPKEVINYAIDNKVSLEEAYKIFLLASEELAEDKEVNMDEHLTPKEKKIAQEFNIQEEIKFIQELEKKIKLEQAVNDNDEVTKEDLEWVEFQLKQIEEMSDDEL
tara:strand:+ start:963 stop:1301 length:339 start_codon:yes stop_codon:yes gene_type:complete